MKKKPASQSAFFNPRIILSFFLCSIGVFLTLLGSGAFSNTFAQSTSSAPDPGEPLLEETEQLSPADNEGRFVQLIEFSEPGLLRRHAHTSGERFRADTPQAQADLEQLKAEQTVHIQVIASAIGRQPDVTHHFLATHSGIATRLTPEEAQTVRMMPGVVSVERERVYELNTFRSPFFIGADEIWDGTAVPGGVGTKGQGIVIAVLDTGLIPTHPSFINDAACGHGVGGAPNKLLSQLDCASADGTGLCNGSNPNDTNGHGSHTASTAGGNTVPTTATPPPSQEIHGVAPCANIRMYKVCPTSSCPSANITAGINSVLLHGDVDAMNFSISGGTSPWTDNDRRFLDLVAAGIVVSASAGNTSAGVPNPVGNVAHRGPWVMTVAASTKDSGGPGTGDILASFSLRGPIAGSLQNLTKPDVTGPGVSIYAARLATYGNLSGTSMSSPHLAGSAALLRSVHPTWLPPEVKSALMMTSFNGGFKENGITPWDPDDVGTGRVDLTTAAKAGLVMNETFANFLAANPSTGGDPRTVNVPSVRDMNCSPNCVWTRTVRNTKTVPTSWTATGSAITPGFTVNVVPSNFNFSGNVAETQVLTITATPLVNLTAAVAFGQVLLTEAGAVSPDERITVAIKGVAGAFTPTPTPSIPPGTPSPTASPTPPATPTPPASTPTPTPATPTPPPPTPTPTDFPGPSPTPTATASPTATATPSPFLFPDLALTKTDSPDPVQVGTNLTYTITVSNLDPSLSMSATMTDILPASVNFVSVTPSQGSCTGTSTIVCNLGSIAAGASATVSLVVTPTVVGTLTNTASVPDFEDPSPGNNSDTELTTVIPAPTSTPTPTTTPPAATPTPSPSPAAQAINLSTRMRIQTGDNVGIGGFIITGSATKHVLIRAIGPSLAGSGVPNALADPVLELHGPGTFVTITNNDWREDPVQEALIEATGIAPTNDLESAIDARLAPGPYTAIVRGNGNASGVGLVEVYDLNQAVNSKLANISTRAFVNTGNDIVIAGFILGNGGGNDRVVVRGLGPSLGAAGVPSVLANPTLELRDNNGALISANNDWQDNPAQAAEITAAGLAPSDSLESAIAAALPPGLYTALLAGVNNGTGNGLVEVYDRGAAP